MILDCDSKANHSSTGAFADAKRYFLIRNCTPRQIKTHHKVPPRPYQTGVHHAGPHSLQPKTNDVTNKPKTPTGRSNAVRTGIRVGEDLKEKKSHANA